MDAALSHACGDLRADFVPVKMSIEKLAKMKFLDASDVCDKSLISLLKSQRS